MRADLKPLLAELCGTFVLVFVGAGAVAMRSGLVLGAALAHGAALAAVVYVLGGASGAHVNPAVTFGLAVTRRIGWARAARYVAAQLLGGILAALALEVALADRSGNLGATLLAEDVSVTQALFLEAVLTAFLALAAAANGGPVATGLAYAAGILVGANLTGASMNPARTLGPGIVAGELAGAWIYLVGPSIGGAAGALLARHLHGPPAHAS